MISRDGVAGLAGLAGSVTLLLLTRGLPHNPLVPIGPAFYPRILLTVSAVLCALLVVSDLRRDRTPRPAPAAINYRLVVWTFVIFGLYVALMPALGYRVSTLLFVLGLEVTLEPPPTARRWALVIAVALGTTLLTWLVFERYLSVLLPRGRLTGF